MKTEIDKIETMLAHFICADADDVSMGQLSRHALNPGTSPGVEVDAGGKLQFTPRTPTVSHIAEFSEDRIFACDSQLLLNSPQDILGAHTEIALVDTNCVKWSCFRKLSKRPRGVWVEKPGATLYEYHSRFILPNGHSDYAKRVAAIDKNGRPVRAIIEGTKNQSNMGPDGIALVIAASIVEDSMRPGVFTATVSDSVGVTFPVAQGHHLEIFKLRDGPLSGSRKRPILHWVASHIRSRNSSEFNVREHLRGVHEFTIDGMNVRLECLV